MSPRLIRCNLLVIVNLTPSTQSHVEQSQLGLANLLVHPVGSIGRMLHDPSSCFNESLMVWQRSLAALLSEATTKTMAKPKHQISRRMVTDLRQVEVSLKDALIPLGLVGVQTQVPKRATFHPHRLSSPKPETPLRLLSNAPTLTSSEPHNASIWSMSVNDLVNLRATALARALHCAHVAPVIVPFLQRFQQICWKQCNAVQS